MKIAIEGTPLVTPKETRIEFESESSTEPPAAYQLNCFGRRTLPCQLVAPEIVSMLINLFLAGLLCGGIAVLFSDRPEMSMILFVSTAAGFVSRLGD